MSAATTVCSLLDKIPSDIQSRVLSHLDYLFLSTVVQRVCHAWRTELMPDNNLLWKAVAKSHGAVIPKIIPEKYSYKSLLGPAYSELRIDARPILFRSSNPNERFLTLQTGVENPSMKVILSERVFGEQEYFLPLSPFFKPDLKGTRDELRVCYNGKYIILKIMPPECRKTTFVAAVSVKIHNSQTLQRIQIEHVGEVLEAAKQHTQKWIKLFEKPPIQPLSHKENAS